MQTDNTSKFFPAVESVPGVGRIVSHAQTSIFPQKLSSGKDAIWYWFEECKCLAKLDPVTLEEIAKISIGNGKTGIYGNPKDLVVTENAIWVSDTGNRAVIGISPITGEILKKIALEFNTSSGTVERFQPFGLAIDENDMWVSDFDANAVLRVDLSTGLVIARIPDIRNPAGLAIGHGAVWVVAHRSGQVLRIDPETNTVTDTISIQIRANPTWSASCGMCINYVVINSDAVWVPLNRGRGIAQIDASSNTVTKIIPLEMPVHQIAIDNDSIWAVGSSVGEECVSDLSALTRINLVTGEIMGTLSIPCAYSVTTYDGDIFVGHGIPGAFTQIIRIQPD